MNVERFGNLLADAHMLAQFGGGAVQIRHGRAGKLELATRFERNAARNLVIAQADGMVPVVKGMPAGFFLDAIEQRPNTLFALIGDGAQWIGVEDVLFVFRADAPLIRRLGAACHRLDQVSSRFDMGREGVGAGHVVLIVEGLNWGANIARARRKAIAFYRQSPMIA